VGGFYIVFSPSSTICLCAYQVTKLGMNLVSYEAERVRRGEKTMERGKGKGSRIVACLMKIIYDVFISWSKHQVLVLKLKL